MAKLVLTDFLTGRATALLGGLCLLASCAKSQPATPVVDTTNRPVAKPAVAANDPLLADVAKARPKITPVATSVTKPATSSGTPVPGEVTARADAQLDAWASANEQIKLAPGFRILAYTGPSRDEAMRIRTAVIRRDPSEHDYLTYEQPTFRLKIGDYFTRLEAEQALVRWRDVIPKGLIVAEPVSVR